LRPYLKKKKITEKGWGVAPGVGPVFKSQYCKKQKKKERFWKLMLLVW
jgi:hypothetical protein